ncbi:N-6 DNA methylase [Saccharibacillus deserti]|uniref:N-6 DNA methylase n=1 Tax=Saccharibacillus deserti TaxID=1634444 RepID=UPI00155171C5|nr:N-6 DNA methylase [Saccharibacillus deserti]
MAESISQGIPSLLVDESKSIRLYKCNDISFHNLKIEGFSCLSSQKKPDQLITVGDVPKKILIGIEDKDRDSQMDSAIQQIKDNYISALPETRFFIARAGERVKTFFKTDGNLLIEINTLKNGFPVSIFGSRVVSGENISVIEDLQVFSRAILEGRQPTNNEFEISPPADYHNPLDDNANIIKKLWQKIFVCTGEQAHNCLSTFVELLVYKGISDASILPRDYQLQTLKKADVEQSLNTYRTTVRRHIAENIFPSHRNGQPGVINMELFAFSAQETTFKSVLQDLDALGNIAQRQLDPDFKRRVMETFLGSSNREGKIKNGQHLTPRNIIQSIWRMANPSPTATIIDPACGVGGFVLEGLNFPFNFSHQTFQGLGIDKSKEMITLAKANMVLHLLDVIASDTSPANIDAINTLINSSFLYTDRNGTGTLSELEKDRNNPQNFVVKHEADYVFANVPFFSSGVSEINKSLQALEGMDRFYNDTGLGIQSSFLKYILGQVEKGNPGMGFVIIPDGILRNVNTKTRDIIKEKADVLAIVSLPIGTFQNNSWKTSLVIFQRKVPENQYSKVMLYKVDEIGVSRDQFRVPIEQNDLFSMEAAWEQRLAGESTDPKCAFVNRIDFNSSKNWSKLFDVFNNDVDETLSFSECIGELQEVKSTFEEKISNINLTLGELFSLDNSIEVELGNENFFSIYTPEFQPTIRYAKTHKGKYPLYSSQVSGPVEFMYDEKIRPILFENELTEETENPEITSSPKRVITWNIKGDAARDVRLHDSPFYGTENRGIIEVLNEELDIEYLWFFLAENLIRLGGFNRENEAHVGKVKRITITIPVDQEGRPDLLKQKQIVEGYNRMYNFKEEMSEIMNKMMNTLDKLNVLK